LRLRIGSVAEEPGYSHRHVEAGTAQLGQRHRRAGAFVLCTVISAVPRPTS
jgi:hypothetical protein